MRERRFDELPKVASMTSASSKSLDQLERETEQNRAELVGTVDALRETILGEVEDMRRKVSIGYVKSEISDYARDTASAWTSGLRRGVRDNPLRSVAIGAGLAVPLWKMGRSVPMPLVLIGAGIALTRPATRNAIGDATAGATMAGDRSIQAAGGVWNTIKAAGSQAGQQAASRFDTARQTVQLAAQDAASRVSDALGAGTDAGSGIADMGRAVVRGGADRAADAGDYVGRTAARTQSAAMDLFHRNPMLVAGAGLAVGALLAAIMPTTEVEGQLLDKVAPDLKRKATDVIDQGYEAASAAASDLYDGAIGRAKDQGLSPEGARSAASDLGEKVGAVVDAAVGRTETTHPDVAPMGPGRSAPAT